MKYIDIFLKLFKCVLWVILLIFMILSWKEFANTDILIDKIHYGISFLAYLILLFVF